eukprot:6647689-Prymnesium_polylepis.5
MGCKSAATDTTTAASAASAPTKQAMHFAVRSYDEASGSDARYCAYALCARSRRWCFRLAAT